MKSIFLIIPTLLLLILACGGGSPEVSDIEATVEARLEEEHAVEATVEAKVEERIAKSANEVTVAPPTTTPVPPTAGPIPIRWAALT